MRTENLARLRRPFCTAAFVVLMCKAIGASAQSVPPAGSPSDVRYTAVQGTAPSLYPMTDADNAKPSALRSEPGLYAANTQVARLVVEVARDAIPADGQSAVKVKVRAFGSDGELLKSPVFVTIENSGGRVLLPGARTDEFGPRRMDADRAVAGVQLKIEAGTGEFQLLAPFDPQDVRLRVSAGSEQAAGTISYVPELRPILAAGLIEGIVNFRHQTTIATADGTNGFESEIAAWSRQFDQGKADVAARAAFFLKGTIRGDVLLTAAYDSDKDTRARLLRDVNPEGLYPVYGDSSLRSFDARSGSKLYVRLDKDKNYLLFGDFVTGDGFTQPIGQGSTASLKQRSLGNYNRTATGVRAHSENDRLTSSAFVFNDTLRQVVEEFASQGSGPYGLRNDGVLEGSEKVEVVVRDRTQPSRIVAVRALTRLVDYSFEPFSGRILLFTFLPSVDENLNPVSLRVTYEVDQGGPAFWVYGGDAQYKVTDQVEVGGSAVVDNDPLDPYRLYSANATLRIDEHTAIVAEIAQTSSTVNTNPTNKTSTPALANDVGEVVGKAWRVEFAHDDEAFKVNAFLGRSDPEFNNPAAPLNGGRGEAQAKVSYALLPQLKAYGEVVGSEDRNPNGGKSAIGGAGLRWAATERLAFDVGVRVARETIGTQANGLSTVPFGSTSGLTSSLASGSGGGALGFGNQAIDPTTGLPIISASGLAPAVSNLPAGTRLESDTIRVGAGYKLTDRVTLGGAYEQEVSGDERRRLTAGADLQINERTKVYGRYERQTGWASLDGVTTTGSQANSMVFGVDSTYLRDTQLFSEYRMRDAISGRDLQLASGVRNFWDVSEGVRLTTALEHIDVRSGSASSSNAASLGLDYSASELWRASGRVEMRFSGDVADTPDVDEKFETTLMQLMLARKLSRDWTLLGRDYFLRTTYATHGGVLQNRAQLGVAYRDTDTNRINALAMLEYKLEADGSNAAVGDLRSSAVIASTHADWHPSRPWWLTGRIAAKWQRDLFELGVRDRFNAQLVSGRVVYDITENWDVGAMAALQTGQYGSRQHAVGIEVGYLLRENLWLSVGFNSTGFTSDVDLARNDYTRRGAYVRLRFKFDENVFKRNDPEVNRSLDRESR